MPTQPLSAHEIAADVRAGRTTVRRVVEAALARIDRLNPSLNAFTVVRAGAALAEADAHDASGPHQGPLAGVPIAVKEEYDVAGDVTTLGGRANQRPAARDCEVVRRLREAGAVIIGRTNMPEFGQFPVGESAHHGATLNPWDPARSPGGSSAGSAVAVATGIVPIAMGSDGGGSLRIPASACGVFGLKPTRGRVSSAPLAEHWYGLATFGAITRTARDMAIVLDVISGNTPSDRWRLAARDRPLIDSPAGAAAARPLRILTASNQIMPGTSPTVDVARVVAAFGDRLSAAGHDVRSACVKWPIATAPFLTLFAAGIAEEARQVDDPDALAPTTKAFARIGSLCGTRTIRAAQTYSHRLAERLDEAFGRADLLMIPTLLAPPVSAHALSGKGVVSSLAVSTPIVSNTALFNVTGHPAASIHAGFTAQGLPVGAQLIARSGREDLLISVAASIEAHAAELSAPVALDED